MFAIGIVLFIIASSAASYWLMNIADRDELHVLVSMGAFLGALISILLSVSALVASIPFLPMPQWSAEIIGMLMVAALIGLAFAAAGLFQIADRADSAGGTVVAGIWGFICALFALAGLFTGIGATVGQL